MTSRKCFNGSAATGLTLIEVLAALALLSTLLVGVLVAFDRHAEQIQRARRTLDVIERVDALLYEWTESGSGVPYNDRGRVPGGDHLLWETRVVNTRYREDLGVDVVRLEVFSQRETVSAGPLVSLEMAVPSPNWPEQGEQR